MEYNFREIEKKWQKRWVENKTYQVTEDETKKEILCAEHVPLPLRCGIACRSSAGIYCFGYLRPATNDCKVSMY